MRININIIEDFGQINFCFIWNDTTWIQKIF